MEQKKSKVTGIIFDKSGQGKNGTWYLFTIGFENGDSGKYFASANPQTYFVNGQEAEYIKDVTTSADGKYTNTNIKPISKGGNGKGFYQGSPTAANKRTALECAVSLAVAGKIPVDSIGAKAVNFNNWLSEEKKETPKQETPPPVKQEHEPHFVGDNEDSLPF